MANKTNAKSGYSGESAPIVIFFGQSAGGKTTALVRLIRYLQNKRYCPELSETFHNYYYSHLEDKSFEDIQDEVESQINIPSYGDILGTKERALLNIRKKEEGCVCRFLEVPGEDFIDLHKAGKIDVGMKESPLDYLKDAMSCEYKKIWVFFFDADFATNSELRKSISDYILAMQDINVGYNDKIIVLINKVDKITSGDTHRPLREDEYEDFVNENFDGVLKEKPFSTKRWSMFGFRKPLLAHYELIGYSSFHSELQRRIGEEPMLVSVESGEEYPQKLWDTIMRAINNRY